MNKILSKAICLSVVTAAVVSTTAFAATATGVSKVELSKKSVTCNINDKITLSSTIHVKKGTNSKLSWSSSNTSVATVSTGKIVAKAPGKAVITATSVADKSKKATCTVTVLKPQFPYAKVTLKVGAKKEINLKNAIGAKWTVGNSKIASIVSTYPGGAYIKGIKAGSTTITATFAGKKYNLPITVTK